MYRFFNSLPALAITAFVGYVLWNAVPTEYDFLPLVVGGSVTIVAAMVLSVTNGRKF